MKKGGLVAEPSWQRAVNAKLRNALVPGVLKECDSVGL